MKFEAHRYWRHESSMDAFIAVQSVEEDLHGVILNAVWCTQGREGWWFSMSSRFKIHKDNFDRWYEYEPYGRQIY